MKVVNIGNIADAFRFDDLPATGIVIEATTDELERLPNLANKEVTISATPRRNCDVGTPEEQLERWHVFCNQYDADCTDCPCGRNSYSLTFCFAKWAQIPYEGGDK